MNARRIPFPTNAFYIFFNAIFKNKKMLKDSDNTHVIELVLRTDAEIILVEPHSTKHVVVFFELKNKVSIQF